MNRYHNSSRARSQFRSTFLIYGWLGMGSGVFCLLLVAAFSIFRGWQVLIPDVNLPLIASRVGALLAWIGALSMYCHYRGVRRDPPISLKINP